MAKALVVVAALITALLQPAVGATVMFAVVVATLITAMVAAAVTASMDTDVAVLVTIGMVPACGGNVVAVTAAMMATEYLLW